MITFDRSHSALSKAINFFYQTKTDLNDSASTLQLLNQVLKLRKIVSDGRVGVQRDVQGRGGQRDEVSDLIAMLVVAVVTIQVVFVVGDERFRAGRARSGGRNSAPGAWRGAPGKEIIK